jgi:DNA-binding GntR family transcriptional regulator
MREKGLPTPSTKKDYVVQVIREAILSGDLQPGERLRQNELAERLQVSATPVREALLELQKEGVLEHMPHKGTTVAQSTVEDIREACLIRGLVGGFAVELAVPNLDRDEIAHLEVLHEEMARLTDENNLDALAEPNREFHMTIYQAAGSKLLYDIISTVWARIPWRDAWQEIPGRAQQVVDEHAKILDMVKRGRAKEAAQFEREHCRKGSQRICAHIAKTRPAQPPDAPTGGGLEQ